ncbi:hypothetical protein [Streptomyces turgidiscabies]|uniref:hypothetical protein n=1 Tax=Streptomyces turgidiscabies TaxID=85558 RepID=UPI0038F7CFA8
MTIVTNAPPTRSGPMAVFWGFLGGCLGGAVPVGFVVGCVLGSGRLIIGSLVLPVMYGLLGYLADAPKRASKAAVVPVTALAMIESLQATGGELSADVPIGFDLTILPDDAPPFRVRMSDTVNLVDVPSYQPRDIVVVEFPPDRPWKVKLVKYPTSEWRNRAADAVVDSALEPTTVQKPPDSGAYDAAIGVGVLIGVAVVLLSFFTGLLDGFKGSDKDTAKPSVTSSSSTSSSTNTTVVSSGSGTVALGPGKSFLDEGELRRAVASLTKGGNKGGVLTVVVQDRMLSVVFPPAGTQVALFDPDSLPYDRIPALVKEATTTLGVDSPQSWQLAADSFTGALTLRVSVTGLDGDTASLAADKNGKVTLRVRVAS